MDFAKLTDEQREFFDANGYLIIPDALDPETIAQVAAAADRLMDDFAYEGYYQHRRDGLVQDPTLAKLATASAIVPLVIQLLGTHIHITNTALIYKHPQPADDPGDCTWHRDVGVHLDVGHVHLPRVGLKVGYCLNDVGRQLLGATADAQGREDPNGIHWSIAEWAAEHGLSLARAPQRIDAV